jgi:hypothetical protein
VANKPYHSLKVGRENLKIRFTTNSIVELEDALGMGVPEMLAHFQLGRPQIKFIRAALWAGLLEEHDGKYDLKDAGELMDRAGFDKVSDVVSPALNDAFPKAEEAKGKKGDSPGESSAGENS